MMTTSSPDPEAAMDDPSIAGTALAPKLDAPQHRPRPLPLFLALLRRETEGEPERLAAALTGLRRYQEAARAAVSEPPSGVEPRSPAPPSASPAMQRRWPCR